MNKIRHVMDVHSNLFIDPKEIGGAFTDYYKRLFTSSSPSNIDLCITGLTEQITPKMNDKLECFYKAGG